MSSKNKQFTSKKDKKKMEELGLNEVELPQELNDMVRKMTEECTRLKNVYRQWSYNKGMYEETTLRRVIHKYLQAYHELYDKERFKGEQKNIVPLHLMPNIFSESAFFKAYDLFKNTWGVRFTTKFLQRLKDQEDRSLMIFLTFIDLLAGGHWPISNLKQWNYGRVTPVKTSNPIPYNAFFTCRIYRNRTMLFSVGVQRLPVMDRQQKITRFQYSSYIQFLDVLTETDMLHNNFEDIINKYTQKLVEDSGRSGFADDLTKDQKVHNKLGREHNDSLLFRQIVNESFDHLYSIERRALKTEGQYDSVLPTTFKPSYISNVESASLVYSQEKMRWTSKDALLRAERLKFNQYMRKVNQEILKKYVDFNSAKNLVELLKKIPNFRIKLTQEEKNVVGQNGNVMVIGRSGTGKTTCAVLRLFAIEMLFKIRVNLNKKKFSGMLKDTRFGADDIDSVMGLHSLFVTASPVLTNEIQRYYKKLTDQIKEELEKKRKKLLEQQAQRKMEEPSVIQESVHEQSVEEVKKEESVVQEVKEQKEPPKETAEILRQQSQKQEEEHMNETFANLNENQQEAQEESEEEDIELEELENRINKFASLNDLEESDFPGFFTVRALIMMLDGTLAKPFFVRNQDQRVIGQESKAAWHNQQRGVMMIENYYKKMGAEHEEEKELVLETEDVNYSDEEELEHQYQRQIRLKEQRNKQDLTSRLKNKGASKLSFEIDFDYFATHFWPQIKKRYYTTKSISAHMIWTEIYSTIKGSANAHLYPAGYLPEKIYLETCRNVFLTVDQKKEIFESYCQYERWKMKMCAYDMMDVVNYILTQMKWRGYNGPSIHYLMIDQVQDLPHATLYLLTKVAEQGVFFSGDTAQTIAKGVGFRFCDLKSMFGSRNFDSELKLTKPTVMQLTVNFRSHNNILQLANSVISIIEILFPATIDRLKKERSNLNGPKPIILADSDIELLFLVLCGQEMYSKQLENNDGDMMKRPPLEFGCDQVIIVRDQQSKKKIPAILQHALCLTIYEAKGLQFNDVILFNFFTESKCSDRWNLIKHLRIIDEEIDAKDYQRSITKHEKEEKPEEPIKEQEYEKSIMESETNCIEEKKIGQKVILKKIKPDPTLSVKDLNDFGELCSQLKMLYTAITRPRNTLIIYDEDSSGRKPLERYWESIDVTQMISKEILESVNKKKTTSTAQVQIFSSLITKTNADEWKRQGIRMFKRKYFEQAMKCFQMSGDTEMYKKAKANSMADESTKEMIETEAEKGYLKGKLYSYASMSKVDLKKAKNKLKQTEEKALTNFIEAGRIFQQVGLEKQAGQCYFSGRQFIKAQQCFNRLNMAKQVAESQYMQHRYIEAAQNFCEADDYLKAIECYDLVNDWQSVLKVLARFTDKIPEGEKQALVRKYSALSLEQLVHEVEFENQPQQQQQQEIIHEKHSDEEDESDEDSDPEIQAEKEYQRKVSAQISRKQSEDMSRKMSEQQSEGMSRKQSENVQQSSEGDQIRKESSEIAEEIKEVKENSEVVEIKEDSFAKLNEPQKDDSSFADLNEPDIESVKSLIDANDQWLSRSISQIQHKKSEYSVIGDEVILGQKARIIKTRGNIFIQDSVMRRIIEIVSIVNTNIVDYLKTLKGAQTLISNSKEVKPEQFTINDFEDIEPEFICKILDTLQSFKIYKLCMFVCNRYHLPSKLGRYITGIALKYSSNAQNNMTITPSLLAANAHRKAELQKGMVASLALHAILENINPEFLKVKIGDTSKKESETLGEYCVTGLIMEGLYKKVIFMLDTEEALSILSNYMESDMYKTMFLTNFMKQVDQGHFSYLPREPVSNQQIELTILTLQASIWRRLSKLQSELITQFYSKQYNFRELFKEHPIPNYLRFNQSLWNFMDNHESKVHRQEFRERLKELSQIITNLQSRKGMPPHQIYDIVTFIILVFHLPTLEQQLHRLLTNQFANIYAGVQQLYYMMSNLKTADNSWWIIRSMLSVYQARIIHGSKIMRIFGDSYIFLHRSSPIAGDLLDQRRRNIERHNQKYEGVQKPPKYHEDVFFIEQQLNVIIAPFFKTFKKIGQRILKKLVGFANLYARMPNYYGEPITMEDHIEQQNRIIFSHFMKDEEKRLTGMIALMKEKNKKQLRQQMKMAQKLKEKTKAKKPSFGFQMLSHVGEEDIDEEDRKIQNKEESLFDKIHIPVKTCHPLLQNYMLKKFLQFSRKHKTEVISGKFLYTTGQNKIYRQYTRACGGYFLYDAIEFRLFNRLDMYGFNLLEVINDQTQQDQRYYIEQLLILLLAHYSSLKQKNFKLELLASHLKYFEGLNFKEYVDKEYHERFFRQAIMDNKQCIFNCEWKMTSEEGSKGIQKMMVDFFNLVKELLEENKKDKDLLIGWYPLLLTYVINFQEMPQEMFEDLRYMFEEISERLTKEDRQPLGELLAADSVKDMVIWRNKILSGEIEIPETVFHQVKFKAVGNAKKDVVDSEKDYNDYDVKLAKRLVATRIITRWWKKISKNHKIYSQQELLDMAQSRSQEMWPIFLHKLPTEFFPEFLPKTTQLTQELISFYLENIVTASLDLHFILMTLGRLANLRERFIKLALSDSLEFEADIAQCEEELRDIQQDLTTWKKDEKWLNRGTVNLKKKKVFEIKWLSKVMKKRAGLKKQAILGQKKARLKK